MSEKDTATPPVNDNGLTAQENRIRLAVEDNFSKYFNESMDNLEKALQNTSTQLTALLDKYRALTREELTNIDTRIGQAEARLETLGKELEALKANTKPPAAVTFGPEMLIPNIGKVIPKEKHGEVLDGFRKLFVELEGKATEEAQRTFYTAGDHFTTFLKSTGVKKEYVHLEKKKLYRNAGLCVAAGIGVGVGASYATSRFRMHKAGRSRTEYKDWLSKKAKPPKASEGSKPAANGAPPHAQA